MKLTVKTISIALGALAAAAFGVWRMMQPPRRCIAIIQTASHPALDATREGFIAAMRARYGSTFTFLVQNAQGNVSQAHAIATQFAQNPAVELIFCIATRAAHAALSTATSLPIVFAAVSDSGLLPLESAIGLVTGTCDMIDCASFARHGLQLVPQVKTVALLCNTTDVSAKVMGEKIADELKRNGKKVVFTPVTSEAEMPIAAALACKQADLVMCPIDTTVALCIDTLAHHGWEARVPVIVCDNFLLKPGILASFGVDYTSMGAQGAVQAAILLDTNGGQVPPVVTECTGTLVCNEGTAVHLFGKVAL